MLEGTLKFRVTKEVMLKTMTKLVASEFATPYGNEGCDVAVVDLAEDKTNDEMAFTITVERTPKKVAK